MADKAGNRFRPFIGTSLHVFLQHNCWKTLWYMLYSWYSHVLWSYEESYWDILKLPSINIVWQWAFLQRLFNSLQTQQHCVAISSGLRTPSAEWVKCFTLDILENVYKGQLGTSQSVNVFWFSSLKIKNLSLSSSVLVEQVYLLCPVCLISSIVSTL